MKPVLVGCNLCGATHQTYGQNEQDWWTNSHKTEHATKEDQWATFALLPVEQPVQWVRGRGFERSTQ